MTQHPNTWLQIHLHVNDACPEAIEQAEEALFETGALSVTLTDQGDDPILEPAPGTTPLWNSTKLSALYNADQSPEQLIETIIKRIPQHKITNAVFEQLENKAWEREWLQYFKPVVIHSKLLITSSHYCEQTHPDLIPLILDPGLAFGTGAHPTTLLCLEWLAQQNLAGKTVIDYGCGSGILAIAAILLGAKYAYAVDIDPQAIIATQENARKNQVEDKIIALPRLESSIQGDLLIANILANPLMALAPEFSQYCKPGADIALSGLLEAQTESVQQAYHTWFVLNQIKVLEGWALLSGLRQKDQKG